jgi:uncharacterized protein
MDKKPIYIKRKIDTKMRELLKLREIVAVVGPRQSGKTTYLQHLMQDVGGSYMTFEDRDVLQMFDTDIKAFVATYLAEVDILCIDEFQYARGGGKQLKYIYDTCPGKKIIISGSSAIDLTIHAVKYLVGRVLVVNFWPFALEELRDVFPHKTHEELYEYYSSYGGYPRVALAETDDERRLILKNIYNTYFLREVKDVLGIVDEYKLQTMLTYIAQGVGGALNYAKMATACSLPERDVRQYLEFMEKTFVTYLVRPFYTNKLREIVKQPKAYFFDSGFCNYVTGFTLDSGKKLEQVVLMEVLKRGYTAKYWRDKREHEMDFIVHNESAALCALEAKAGGRTSESFRAFVRAYPDVPAEIVTSENISKLLHAL